MNSASGNSRRPCSRRTIRVVTTIPTQAARRVARSQSPRYAIWLWRPKAVSQASGTSVRPTASPISAAPIYPAAGSIKGSRVVTRKPTSSQMTAAAAKSPRLASRSRGSMTIESRTSEPAFGAAPGEHRARSVHRRCGHSARTAECRRVANGDQSCSRRRVGRIPYGWGAAEARSAGDTGWADLPKRAIGAGEEVRGRVVVARAHAGCRLDDPGPGARQATPGRRPPGRRAPIRGSGARRRRAVGPSSPHSPSRRSGAGTTRGHAGGPSPGRAHRMTCSP